MLVEAGQLLQVLSFSILLLKLMMVKFCCRESSKWQIFRTYPVLLGVFSEAFQDDGGLVTGQKRLYQLLRDRYFAMLRRRTYVKVEFFNVVHRELIVSG